MRDRPCPFHRDRVDRSRRTCQFVWLVEWSRDLFSTYAEGWGKPSLTICAGIDRAGNRAQPPNKFTPASPTGPADAISRNLCRPARPDHVEVIPQVLLGLLAFRRRRVGSRVQVQDVS